MPKHDSKLCPTVHEYSFNLQSFAMMSGHGFPESSALHTLFCQAGVASVLLTARWISADLGEHALGFVAQELDR